MDPADIRELLESWPCDDDNSARIVRGNDGREVLQVRLPLGLEQYEIDGRPDGQKPYGMESALDYQLHRLAEARSGGQEAAFTLSSDDCAELFSEGTMVYQRYLRLFQLKDWKRTARDTSRNLRLFDFVQRYAEREEDQMYLEQWRPYIVRMNAVARAMMALERGHHDHALEIVTGAVSQIETLPEIDEETFRFERKRSLMTLRELAQQIKSSRPLTALERLERELKKAVERQEFERAAQLRDEIRAQKKIEPRQ